MQQAAAAFAPSRLVLGRYRPVRPLGSGGSGSVWLARDESTGLDVALKIVPREGKAASRAEREAAAAARLRHERCLRAYALARDSDHVYIAYEYVPGRTLRHALRSGELDDEAAIEAAAQILEGLAHAHARRIVHRDVKPANVLLAEGDEVSVRLLDFGLALIQEEETLTATGDVPGTLAYISPERLRGEAATPAADVWSVGVLLWEALAGHHPFWSASLLETARKIEGGTPSLAEARPDLPKALVAQVDRALSLDPTGRPSAAKLAASLRHTRASRGPKLRIVPGRAPRRFAKLLPAPLAAIFAGWSAAALPFYPAGWPLGLAAIAALLSLVRERAGLAFALAVPLLPLGNVALGLGLLYGAIAASWLALSWRDPRGGLFCVLGPLLAPIGGLGLLPLAAQAMRGPVRRAAAVATAALLAVAVAGVRRAPLPFSDSPPPDNLGLARVESPLAAAGKLWSVVAAQPALGLEGLVLAAAAALLPLARRGGLWRVAGFGAAMLAGTLLLAPKAAALPLVTAVWVTCAVVAVLPRMPEAAAGLGREVSLRFRRAARQGHPRRLQDRAAKGRGRRILPPAAPGRGGAGLRPAGADAGQGREAGS